MFANEMEMRFQNKLQNDGKFLPKHLILKPKNPFIEVQHANRLVITSTNNFVPEKTSIPSLDHRNFLPRARYTEPWADLEFGNGIPKDSDDFGNGIEKCLKLEWKWSLEFRDHLEWKSCPACNRNRLLCPFCCSVHCVC